MNTDMNFVDILKDIMVDQNLNRAQIAKLVGVKPSQVSEWLSGKYKPGYDTLRAICKGLGVSGDDILGLK
ncbi:MAG: helix-turn-helix domain-containing protein [Candidatus Caccovivens sp.]